MESQEEKLARKREEISQKAGAAISGKASDLRWTFLVRGFVALLLGIAALVWPSSSISLLLRLFGLFLLLDAAFWIFGARRRSGDVTEGAPGILSGLIGFALLFVPAASARLVFVLLGLWAILTGAGYLLDWWRAPSGDRGRDTSRNVGLFALAGGLVLLFWPGTGVVALGWMLAILAFAIAAAMFFIASRFGRVGKSAAARRS